MKYTFEISNSISLIPKFFFCFSLVPLLRNRRHTNEILLWGWYIKTSDLIYVE